MISTASLTRPWRLVEWALSLSLPLGFISLLFGLLPLLGYLSNTEILYRPLAGGEATNPITAFSIIFLALSICLGRLKESTLASRFFVVMALCLISIRLIDYSLATDMTNAITPFHDYVFADRALGKSNEMGINTTITLLLASAAILLRYFHQPTLSQLAAFISLAIPTISITGYAYGIEVFYGKMSLLTTVVCFLLATSALTMTADHGGLRAILSPYLGGTIARIQTLAGYIVPFSLGLIITNTFKYLSDKDLFGIFVVAICWFIILMVSMTAAMYESVDQKRREAVQLLANAAMTDHLTGLPNRRQFMEFSEHEFIRAQRTHIPLWVLVLDIDKFKVINDTAGHAVGDRVLIELAKVLQKTIRSTDLVGRIGGEEFAVLLSDSSAAGAQRVASQLLENIEAMTVEGWTEAYGSVTASIGVANSSGTDNVNHLIRNADNALYKSKMGGRNQVTFFYGAAAESTTAITPARAEVEIKGAEPLTTTGPGAMVSDD